MKQLLYAGLALVLMVAVACKPRVRATAGSTKIEYSPDLRPLDYANRSFRVYSLENKNQHNVESARVRLNATLSIINKDLRFLPDTITDTQSRYISYRRADDPSGVFEVNKITGRIVFNKGVKEYTNDSASEGLPENDRAVELARRYINLLNLSVQNGELSSPEVSGLEMSVKKEQEKPQTFRKMVTVRFNRVLDGMPVEGATRLLFSFGKKEELTSLIADWGKWQGRDVSPEQVITPDRLQQQIDQSILAAAKGSSRIIVQKRELVLYDDGAGTMEPAIYIKAVLRYPAKAGTADQEYEVPYDFYQPIIRNSTALFPQVKDRLVNIQPKVLRTKQQPDTVRRTIDE